MTAPSRSGAQRVWLALSMLLTAATVVALTRWLDVRHIVEVVRSADRAGLIAGLLLFAMANVLKAERLRAVTATPLPIGRWAQYGLVCLYNFFSTMLPAGVGELSYPAMLRSGYATPLAAGVAALIITRILDLLVVAICVLAALGAGRFEATGTWAQSIVSIAAAVVVLAALILAAVAVPTLIRRLALHRSARIVAALADALDHTAAFATWSSRIALGLLTLAIWATGYLASWRINRALGFGIDLRIVVLCSSLALLLSALPFKGFFGFGTQHVAWVAGLALVGWSTTEALQLATALHLIVVAYTAILGGVGAVLMIANRDIVRQAA